MSLAQDFRYAFRALNPMRRPEIATIPASVAALTVLLLAGPALGQNTRGPRRPQPLSPDEVKTVREGIKQSLMYAPGPEMELISSWKAGTEQRATFAQPFTDVSDRLKVKKTIACQNDPNQRPIPWVCWETIQGQLKTGGSVFALQNMDGATAATIVDEMHSPCFRAQAAKLARQVNPLFVPFEMDSLFSDGGGNYHGWQLLVGTTRLSFLRRPSIDRRADGCGFEVVQDPFSAPQVQTPVALTFDWSVFWFVILAPLVLFVVVARRRAIPDKRLVRSGLHILGAVVVFVGAMPLIFLVLTQTGLAVFAMFLVPFLSTAPLIQAVAFAAAAVASRVFEERLSRDTVALGVVALLSVAFLVIGNALLISGHMGLVAGVILLYSATTFGGAVTAYSRVRRATATTVEN